jgi:hypothetical protein
MASYIGRRKFLATLLGGAAAAITENSRVRVMLGRHNMRATRRLNKRHRAALHGRCHQSRFHEYRRIEP